MEHRFVEHKGSCPNGYGCPICDGGLALCEVCGCFEGSLPSECPGEKVSEERQTSIYNGKIDFRGGKWVRAVSPACPAG